MFLDSSRLGKTRNTVSMHIVKSRFLHSPASHTPQSKGEGSGDPVYNELAWNAGHCQKYVVIHSWLSENVS